MINIFERHISTALLTLLFWEKMFSSELKFLFYLLVFSVEMTFGHFSNMEDFKRKDYFNVMNGEVRLKNYFLLIPQHGFFDSLVNNKSVGAENVFSCSNGRIDGIFSKFKLDKRKFGICEILAEKDIEDEMLQVLREKVVKVFIEIEFDQDHLIKDLFLTTDNAHHISQLLLLDDATDIEPKNILKSLSNFSECSFDSDEPCFITEDTWRHFIIKNKVMNLAKKLIIMFDKENERNNQLFPLIKHLSVSESCKCAGNSTRCQVSLDENKILTKHDKFHCQCTDGWSGANCDVCLDGFHKKTVDIHNNIHTCQAGKSLRRRKRRQACTCDRIGTFYNLCHPLPAHNHQCICKRGYAGKFCNKCSSLSYGYPKCKPCDCNIFGALVSKCDDVTGACSCRDRVSGRKCDQCAIGFYRYPVCRACKCPKQRTKSGVCNAINGACICNDNFNGEKCQRCKDGYYDYPECKACNCNTIGSNSTSCDFTNGQCVCNNGFTGLKCGVCSDPNQKFPNCFVVTTVGPRTNGRRNFNCKETNSCPDKQQQQQLYSRCKDLFFNDTESRISSCVPCGCFGEGTLASVLKCDKVNGQCPCKNNVDSRSCDSCKNGYFNLRHYNIFGCNDCKCDHGGSINLKCDYDGKCRCKRNIAGKRCNSIQNGDYFLPDHYHMKYEFEESKLENGKSVSYRYSQAEFPHFTWKGYVAIGQEQSNVFLRFDVPKTSNYRLLFRYVILSKSNALAVIIIYKNPMKESSVIKSVIKFKVDIKSFLHGQYAESEGLSETRLTKGQWQLHVSSNNSGLFLDHVVLMPKEYYNPKKLLQPKADPCSLEMHQHEICSMFDYISLEKFNTVKSNAGFVADSRGTTRALTFDDPDVTRQLKSNSLAGLSSMQPRISFNITSSKPGKYVVLVEYFVSDKKVHRIDIVEDFSKLIGHWMALHCPYKFLCRSVVLDKDNIPATVTFESEETKTISMVFGSDGMLGIHSITAIPYEEYTIEYIKPTFRCMTKKDACLSYPKLPSLDDSVPFKNTQNTSGIEVSFNIPAVLSVMVKEEGWWVVVVQFRQPKHPRFIAELTLKSSSEKPIKHRIEVKFCPSQTGCRVKTAIYAREGELNAEISAPRGKEFSVDSLLLFPEDRFNNMEFHSEYIDISADYLRLCVDENSLPIVNKIDSLCQNAFFSQLSAFNDGASPCNCDPYGSKHRKCNKNGGQCQCKKNVIGRRCQSCRAGFYNFPNCRNCRCFMAGSLSPECDRNGKCQCKQEYGGLKCDRCKSSLFYAFPECKPCNCDAHGSLSLFCSPSVGQCQCLRNFRGRNCNQCAIGFHSFPSCSKCQCHAAGVIINKNQSNTCTPSQNGRCLCKKYVEGNLCDRCQDLYYNLQIRNPFGCTSCNCDTSGTLSGIASCDKNNGKCPCKKNVDDHSRTCDTCKDGFYGLSRANIFGCKACDCNQGGATSHICDKKSGQCKCKPNITGRKCDRLISDSFYIPRIQHLVFDEKSRVDLSKDKNKMNVQWKINVPKRSSYLLIIGYKLQGNKDVNVDISILYSAYQSVVHQSRLKFQPSPLNSSVVQNIPIQKDGKDLYLTLYQGMYDVKFVAQELGSSDFNLMYISLIPKDYISGESLKSTINDACIVSDSSQPCIKYVYLNTQKNGVYSIELETSRNSGAELFNQKKFPLLNMNGAVSLRYGQTFTISFDQPSNGKFVFLLQYFYPQKIPANVMIHLQGPDGLQTGVAEFATCPYVFTCRQIVLDETSKVKKFLLKKDSKYHVSFSLLSIDEIALDLLTMIPEEQWNTDFLKPSEFCTSFNNKCKKSEFKFSEDFVVLKSADSIRYKKPSFLPPNVPDSSLKVLLLETESNPRQITLRWNESLKRGRFFALLHYYQPSHKAVKVKAIIHTLFYSVAGMFELAYCPHVSGCRTELLIENSDFNSKQALYLSGNNIGITLSLPSNFKIWLDHLLFVRTYDYQDDILREKPSDFSLNYKRLCINNYNINVDLTKTCLKWIFGVTMKFNNRPFNCDCNIEGSIKASCNHIGGQCECKTHVTGRACVHCQRGYQGYPTCIRRLSKKLI